MKNSYFTSLDLRLFDVSSGSSTPEASASDTASVEENPLAVPSVGFANRRKAAVERERMARNAMSGRSDKTVKMSENAENSVKMSENTENLVKMSENDENSEKEPQENGSLKQKSGSEQFEELMKNPEFRKAFSNKAQGIIDQRFKEFKSLQTKYEALEPIIEALAEKYGTEKGDISALAKAFAADGEIYDALGKKYGMSGQQYRNLTDTQRLARNEQRLRIEVETQMKSREAARRIREDAEALKQLYSDFDLGSTLSDAKVREMLKCGVPLKTAYEAANIDKILQSKEQAVLENIKARNDRPIEGGANDQSGAVAQNLSARLTRQDRERLAQRAIRGEKISL